MPNDLPHSLQVALVSVHNDVFLADVVGLGHLLTEGLDGGLHEALLCVNVKHAVSLVGELSDGSGSFGECFEDLHVSVVEPDSAAHGDSSLEVSAHVWLESEEVAVGVDLEARDGFGVVVLELKGLNELVQLCVGKLDSSFQERVLDVASVNCLLLVELEDVVHEDLLGSAHPCHDVGRNKPGELEGEVAFGPALGLVVDALEHMLESLLDERVIVLIQAFDHVVGNSKHVCLF